jgi:probable F420-dependent oxidoreductase
MHLGFNLHLPDSLTGDGGPWFAPGLLQQLASEVEAAGFAAVSVPDHPFPPVQWVDNGGHHALDPFVALSFLAAGSSRIRLLTNVLVLPYRNPVTTAKAIASLDVLSGGRLIVGTAIGYLREEFDVIGADFAARASVFEQTVVAMRDAWASADAPGTPAHIMLPVSTQRPHPPLWVGGNSGSARRRAVAFGDGWMPFAQSQASSAVTCTPALRGPDDLARLVAELEEARTASGRPTPLDVCFSPPRRAALHRQDGADGEMDEEVAAYARAGATWLTLRSMATTPDALRRELERWAPLLARHGACGLVS